MRTANRLLAALIALALAAIAVIAAVEIVLGRSHRDHWLAQWERWYRTWRTTPWDSTGTRVVFGLLLAAGLVLLLLQVLRRPAVTLPLTDGEGMAPAVVRRKHLERALSSDALGIDGVASARAKISRRRFAVAANTNRIQPKELEGQLYDTVDDRLKAMGLAEPLPVSVDLRHRTAPNAQGSGRVE